MKTIALFGSACAALLLAASVFAPLATAQQVDIMVGGSTLMSPSNASDLVSVHPPIQRGGTFVGVSGNYLKFRHHLGLNAETSWRYRDGDYDATETYRPFFTDVNALFQPRLTKKSSLDIFAGVGVASYRFNLANSCSGGGCVNFTNSNHFMEDLGLGFRYYVWNRFPHVFVRPEAHYYHIQNNVEFSSPNVFRVGASIGYTFGR